MKKIENLIWKEVSEYQLSWRLKDKIGIVYLFFKDGSYESLKPKSLAELSHIGNLIRNETPIYFHTKTKDLTTGREPTGEQELGIDYLSNSKRSKKRVTRSFSV